MATDQNYCHFYLKRKNRFCRFKPKVNQMYCPEHICVMGIQEGRKRIRCPLNPNHNCYEDELKKHLKKCNVTKYKAAMEKLPYFVKGINKGTQEDNIMDKASEVVKVKELPSVRLAAMIEKVNRLHSECVEKFEKLYFEHPRIKEEVVGSVDADMTKAFGEQALLRKEMLQQASLIGQLNNLGFLSNGHCFVELGAGKGKLSHWIDKACDEHVDNSFILVERSSVRYKVDASHKSKTKQEDYFQRLKIDIQDFCLGKVPGIQDKGSVVVVGKHLCGGATDLGIRCAVNTLRPSHGTSDSQQGFDTQCVMSDKDQAVVLSVETDSYKIKHTIEEKNNTEFINTEKEKADASQLMCPKPDVIYEDSLRRNLEVDNQSNHHCDTEDSSKSAKTSLNSDEALEPPAKVKKVQETQAKNQLEGIMIALCCHHQCTWDVYVGQKYMKKHGINEREFDLLTRLSSWATCARIRIRGKSLRKKDETQEKDESSKEEEIEGTSFIVPSKTEEEKDTDREEHSVEDLIGDDGIHLRKKLSVHEREIIGRKAKRIIDMGRIEFLRSKNMNCFLREYIDEITTPENIVLLATNANDKFL